MGSQAVAAWIAHLAFWGLLVYGWLMDALTAVQAGVMLALWAAGAVGLGYVPYAPARAMFPSLVAILDIALVFMIFKGDVRLS
jgi:hypothetical protein